MYLEVFADNPYATNCWLVAAEGRDDAVLIDPGFAPERVLALLGAAGKRPVAVLATHGHDDHIGAVAEVCGADVRLHIHADDELALTDPIGWGAGYASPPCRPAIVRPFVDGEVIEAAGLTFEAIHTPGHTPGSSCFRLLDLVFSGDLVFRGSIGRSDFPNSSPEAMTRSLQRFLELPEELVVYPGHLESTTVGAERATNPFLLQLA